MTEIELTQVPEERRMTAAFKGYQRYKRIEEGAFSDCLNMGSEEAPCACVRRARKAVRNTYHYTEQVNCMPGSLADAVTASVIAWDDGGYMTSHDSVPAWLDSAGTVSCGKHHWETGGHGRGRLLVFGNGLFETETGTYIPDRNLTGGARKVSADVIGHFKVFPAVAEADGSYMAVKQISGSAPREDHEDPAANPQEGDYYYNTLYGGLYRYVDGKWTAWPFYHMMLEAYEAEPDETLAIGSLRVGDGVRVDITETPEQPDADGVRVAAVSDEAGAEYIVIETRMQVNANHRQMTVKRRYPFMDYCVVNNNRIWGCRYGQSDNGEFVNEIYACALGDPCNWFLLGTGADNSFITGVGEPGPWTGAAVLNGNVVFFKEDCIYTVYGDTPGSFTVHLDKCAGIAAGSDRSAAIIGGALYYHSPIGFMRLYSGGLPILISDEVGYKNQWTDVIAGTDGRKYYADAETDNKGSRELLVYDAATGLWMKEDSIDGLVCMLPYNNALAAVCRTHVDESVISYDKIDVTYLSPPERDDLAFGLLYLGMPADVTSGTPPVTTRVIVMPWFAYWTQEQRLGYENEVKRGLASIETFLEWSFETGDFGHEAPEYKRVKSLAIRAWKDAGAEYTVSIMYDEDGEWRELKASDTYPTNKYPKSKTGSNRVEYRLRRCDVFRLRFEGRGRVCVYSITQVYDTQGDRAYGTN